MRHYRIWKQTFYQTPLLDGDNGLWTEKSLPWDDISGHSGAGHSEFRGVVGRYSSIPFGSAPIFKCI